jgi:uncharacterized protein (TIGR03437 family)
LVPSAKQINVQVPVETPDGQVVTVQVRSALGAGNSFPVVVTPFAPGIFHVTSPSTPTIFRNAAALFAGTAWRVMPRMLARALSIPDDCRGLAVTALCGQPAAPGDYIQVYLTGLGRATPGGDPAGRPLGTGETAALSGNPLYITVQKPNVRIGTIAPEVQFSGVAPGYGGLYQLNLRIPFETPVGDDVPLFVGMTAGDRGYSDTATLAIER